MDSKKFILLAVLALMFANFSLGQDYPIWDRTTIFVQEMFVRILGRDATSNDIQGHITALWNCQIEREDTIRILFYSQEYANRQRTNREFVSDCYIAIIRRHAHPSEILPWLIPLNNGSLNRAQVIEMFLYSGEYQNNIAIHEEDCRFPQTYAFHYVFPGNGYTISHHCEYLAFEVPNLNKFELTVTVTNLPPNSGYPYKAIIAFIADMPYLWNTFQNSAMYRKYGYYPDYVSHLNRIKFAYVLDNHFEFEDYDFEVEWNSYIIYEFTLIVSDEYVALYRNNELMVAGPKGGGWNPTDQVLFIGSPYCAGDSAGTGSHIGARYLSIKMIDLD